MDTASTFKLGVFPYTDDPSELRTATAPTGRAGRATPTTTRATRPGRWPTRSPTRRTRRASRSRRARRGSARTRRRPRRHAYAGGGYKLEVKVPMAVLPAAVDPDAHRAQHHAVRQRRQRRRRARRRCATSTTATRLAWSAFGSVQSDPYRWGHASVTGYTPPPDRPTTPAEPNVVEPERERRRLAADDPPVGAQRRADRGPHAGAGGRPDPKADASLAATAAEVELPRRAPAARAFPVVGREGLHPGLEHELLAGRRSAAELRADGVRRDRRDDAARGRPT